MTKKISMRFRFIFTAAALAAGGFVYAGPGIETNAGDSGKETSENPGKKIIEPATDQLFWDLDLIAPAKGNFEYRLPADISGGDGRLGAYSAGAEFSARYSGETNLFFGSLGYHYTHYRFDGAPAPFSNTEDVHALLRGIQFFHENWGAFLDLDGHMASETKASLARGCTLTVGFGACYRVSDDLIFYFGAQAGLVLEDRLLWMPYGGIEWTINKHWSLSLTNGLVVTCDVYGDESLRIDLSCAYMSSYFRLPDQSTPTGMRSMALKIQEVPLSVSVTKQFLKRGYVRGTVGAILYGRYDFQHDKDAQRHFRTEPAPFFNIEAGVQF